MKSALYIIPIITQGAIYLATRTLFGLCANLSIRGVENLGDVRGPTIFVANHMSEWDGILVRAGLPFFSKTFSPMYYVARTGWSWHEFRWRSFIYKDFILESVGAIQKTPGNRNYAITLSRHIALLKKGRCVCIFPEGKIIKDGGIAEVHGGVGYLAHVSDATLIPVSISGSNTMRLCHLFSKRSDVTLTYGKPIPAHVLLPHPVTSIEQYKQTAQRIMNEIKTLSQVQPCIHVSRQ